MGVLEPLSNSFTNSGSILARSWHMFSISSEGAELKDAGRLIGEFWREEGAVEKFDKESSYKLPTE